MKSKMKIAGGGLAVLITVIAFQNCSPNSGFDSMSMNEFSSSGFSDSGRGGAGYGSGEQIAPDNRYKEPTTNFNPISSSSGYVDGEIYGHCNMQLDGSFKVAHNGRKDSSGREFTHVPSGLGGGTFPIVNCPNSGSDTTVTCAEGFRPVQTHVTQLDCRHDISAPLCNSYYITYGCMKGADSINKISGTNTGGGSGSGGTSPGTPTLQWVTTKSVACFGPASPPYKIGSACGSEGQQVHWSCGTITCQYK